MDSTISPTRRRITIIPKRKLAVDHITVHPFTHTTTSNIPMAMGTTTLPPSHHNPTTELPTRMDTTAISRIMVASICHVDPDMSVSALRSTAGEPPSNIDAFQATYLRMH